MTPERITITQRPMQPRERLRAALRHTDDDLFESDDRRLLITSRDDAGERVLLGWVDPAVGLQCGREALRELITHVLFAPHRSSA